MKTNFNSQAVRTEVLNAIANHQTEQTKRPNKWVYILTAGFILFTGISAMI